MDCFQVLLQSRSIIACKCISKLALSRPPSASMSSLDLGLHVGLQTPSTTASECISEFTQFWTPSASLGSLEHRLQVHLSTCSIMASKYIVNERRRVSRDTGVTEVIWATGSTYSGDSYSSHLDIRHCMDSHGRVVSYLPTYCLRSSS